MKSPTLTTCDVWSLKVNRTDRLPASAASVIYKRLILKFGFNVCTAYYLLLNKEINPFIYDILVVFSNKFLCHFLVFCRKRFFSCFLTDTDF